MITNFIPFEKGKKKTETIRENIKVPLSACLCLSLLDDQCLSLSVSVSQMRFSNKAIISHWIYNTRHLGASHSKSCEYPLTLLRYCRKAKIILDLKFPQKSQKLVKNCVIFFLKG